MDFITVEEIQAGTKSGQTICLNMIVKNEAHIIGKTLNNLTSQFNFSYWVISDTGSTDSTVEIIETFFKTKNIPGTIHHDEWSNFGHNRTVALNHAFKKSDYVLVFDADDEIEGKLLLPEKLTHDAYSLTFGSLNGFSYHRPLLINNHKKWQYIGVLHEYLDGIGQQVDNCVIQGGYSVVSGRSGSRNNDPKKYLKDATVLENAYNEIILTDDKNALGDRYAFYCANSFFDYGDYESAAKWYKITLTRNGWDQEKYMCCYKLYKCYKNLKQIDTSQFYLVKSFYYDKDRTECVYKLIAYYCNDRQYDIAYGYYSVIKKYYEADFLEDTFVSKLFVDNRVCNFYLPYFMIIVSEKVKQYETMVKMFQIIFLKRTVQIDPQYMSNLLYNFQFVIPMLNDIVKTVPDFVQHMFELFNNYIAFAIESKYDVTNYDFWEKFEQLQIPIIVQILKIRQEKSGIKPLNGSANNSIKPIKFDASCKTVLIFAGFGNTNWNYTYGRKNALGGSERAVNYLAAAFPKDYNIIISGNVEEETIGNVQYLHLSKLSSLISQTTFHTIVVSRYISFYDIFSHAKALQTFVWVHDTALSPYGCNLSEFQILEKHGARIDGVVCLTEWHKTHIGNRYPSLKPKIHIINNGIVLNMFKEPSSVKKVKNRFVYTSCSERGLERLLQLWLEILKHIPTAELKISSYNNFPSNADDERMLKIIKQYPSSIQHCGKLSQAELYNLMECAEYWLYPSDWPETSCITAIEMMRSGVLCLYYPGAGLTNTMNGNGIQMQPKQEINALIALHNSPQQFKNDMIAKGIEYANSCSWDSRAIVWHNMLQTNVNAKMKDRKYIKIINLPHRSDRKTQMTGYLNAASVENYDFIKAVYGKDLEPTLKIKELFLGNDFKYRKAVIGCALSHINLWEELLADCMNDYYVILEDDVTLCDDFKNKLDRVIELYKNKKVDYLLIGSQKLKDEKFAKEELDISVLQQTISAYGAFGYIINKTACDKILKYINVHHVTRAIDWVGIYVNAGVEMWTVNKCLVDTPSFQLNNNQDTDIQMSYDAFDFSALENVIKVAYVDWWHGEYCGGHFDKNNNFLINIMKKNAALVSKSVMVVEHNESPNVLFYSLFGNTHAQYINNPNIRCIFYSGEPYPARVVAAYNFTFDKSSVKKNNTRLPLWIMYDNSKLIQLSNDRKNGIFEKVDKKERFCSCIVTNNGNEIRRSIIELLSTYKRVDCGGAFLNNIGYSVPRGINNSGKLDHNKHYKFVLAMENKDYPGYCTEKLADAYKSGSLPIYWGNKEAIKDFNPKSFINANDFNSIHDLVQHIVKVDNDDKLFESYFKEPILVDYWLDILNNTRGLGDAFYKGCFNNIMGTHDEIIPPANVDKNIVSIYNVWHHKLFDDMYIDLDEETLRKITMYGVNSKYPKEYTASKQYNILYEYDLPIFNGLLQEDGYCQTSAFYHTFLNNLHENSKYIGFIQYDMKIGKNMFKDIELSIAEHGDKLLFYHLAKDALYMFKNDYGSHGLCQPYDNSVLEQYNQYFNTNYTLDTLLTYNDTCKVILLHTFVITKEMFAKMMRWFNSIFDWLHVNVQNKYYKSDRASFTEKMFALFLYIEQIENPTMKLLEMSIEHIWPMLHNQTSWENYKNV
jgi:GR25 family glycosyltransferase involved in LPS biosynthesis